MQKITSRSLRPGDIFISFVVLALLLLYTYGLLVIAPYPGFYLNPSNGEVLDVYQPQSDKIKEGDIVERVGSISLDDFHNDKTLNFFEGVQPGQTVEIAIQRNGKSQTVEWVYPTTRRPGFLSRFFNIWWLAYIFWLIGMATQLFMRPKDTKWRLFVASNYLSGLFIMFGSVSSFQVMGSSVLMRVVAWLLLPAYLHFHWVFPQSFRRIPQWLKVVFYAAFSLLAVAQVFMLIPAPLYFLAIVLAFGGSIVLLIFHFILQPDHRREVRGLVIASLVSLFFAVLIGVIGSSGSVPQSSPLALLSLPILPSTYFYLLYRHSMGGLELRTNRTISLYLFLVLLGTVLLLAVVSTGVVEIPQEIIVFIVIVVALITTAVSILIFPAFQSFVERRILGIKLPSQSLSEDYSARIITSDTLSGLLTLLKDEFFPSLLIRQYAFVRNLDVSAQVLISENVSQDQVPEEALKDVFASLSTGKLTPLSKMNPPLDWVLLTLPLRFGSDLIGVWLLGRRDPDDWYPQVEVPILQSLANQTAVALSTIIQTERLKAIYEANINRYEQERLKLAHDLHDSVLNEMAAMLMKNDSSSLSPEFQESYGKVIGRVREIVTDFRPPMFTYGLKFALDGLADNLSERHQDRVQIISDIRADEDCRYPELVEHNLYRIVQEACENALKYSRAKSIKITGMFSSAQIDINVSDDGVGFNIDASLNKLDNMIANKHYGLAGMHERAGLIGAAIRIDSKPEQGTRIHVLWEVKNTI